MSEVQKPLLEQKEKTYLRLLRGVGTSPILVDEQTYYLAKKDRIRAYQKRYRMTEMGRATRIRYRRRQRQRVIAALGGKCAKCGFSDWRALQIDHINGGGSRERRHIGAPRIFSKILRGETEGYQLLCANCNWIKRYEEKEATGRPIELSWLEKEDLKWNESN